MIRDRKLIALTVVNIMLVLMYVLFAYGPAGGALSASLLSLGRGTMTADLTVAQATSFGLFDPHGAVSADAVSVGLSYDPLIRFDAFLSFEPALATSWYWQSDTDFVVQLRDAQFHDGSMLDCADVEASLTRAQTTKSSGIASLFAGVTVAPHEETAGACVFSLSRPDHTFTRKLTKLFIIAADAPAGDTIGTGRYQLLDHDATTRIFSAFADYYAASSDAPETVTLLSLPKKYQRLAMLREGSLDILLDAPSSFVTQIEERLGYTVAEVPSAETTFTLFNFATPQLADPRTRNTIAEIVRAMDLEHALADRSLTSASQFVPSGVFGFAPSLLDAEEVELAPLSGKVFLSLAVTEINRKIGEVLQRELAPFNVDLSLSVLTEEDVTASLKNGTHDLFVIGWHFGLGTADDLFADLIHSPRGSFGSLNGYGYARRDVNAIIERALTEPDDATRLLLFQELMERVVREDVIGLPLVDTRRLYAVRDGLPFQPRMDGLLIFDTQ